MSKGAGGLVNYPFHFHFSKILSLEGQMPCSGSPCELMRAQVVISHARSLSTASPTSELFSYIQFKIIPNVGGIVR